VATAAQVVLDYNSVYQEHPHGMLAVAVVATVIILLPQIHWAVAVLVAQLLVLMEQLAQPTLVGAVGAEVLVIPLVPMVVQVL
jgi:hypothetical protein